MSGERLEVPLDWDSEDCFWCGRIWDPSTGPCPDCNNRLQTGPINVIDGNDLLDL